MSRIFVIILSSQSVSQRNKKSLYNISSGGWWRTRTGKYGFEWVWILADLSLCRFIEHTSPAWCVFNYGTHVSQVSDGDNITAIASEHSTNAVHSTWISLCWLKSLVILFQILAFKHFECLMKIIVKKTKNIIRWYRRQRSVCSKWMREMKCRECEKILTKRSHYIFSRQVNILKMWK